MGFFSRLFLALQLLVLLTVFSLLATAKVHLDKTYLFAGKFYGPGPANVPQEFADNLKTREDEDRDDQPEEPIVADADKPTADKGSKSVKPPGGPNA